MLRTHALALGLAVAVGLSAAACGADDPSEESDVPTTEAEEAAGAIENPNDLGVVCMDGTALPGAAEYDPSVPGPHPVQIFEPTLGGSLITTSESLPEGWAPDVDDPSTAALIACLEVANETPNGTTCPFDEEDGATTLLLVDATYDVTVYEATTAHELGSTTIEATSTVCPMVVMYDPSDPRYVNTPTEAQYQEALAEFVMP